jgi:hypothetical protein
VNAAPGRLLHPGIEAAVDSPNPPLSMDQPAEARAAKQTAYPSVFFNDDLSAVPLYPPPLRRTLTRDLPRVELEHPSRGPAYAAGMSTASITSSDEVRIEHADTSAMYTAASDDDRIESERWDLYRSDPQQRRFDWADEEEGWADYQRNGDDDFSSSSSGGYSADESPYSDDEDDEDGRSSVEDEVDDGTDEPRPFPDPRVKNQQKYIRPPEHDLEYPPPPRGPHPADAAPAATRPAKPNLLSDPIHSPPTHAAVTAYSYVPSLPASALSHLSPYASPLASPTLATATHEVRIEPVPSALPSPTSEEALQYDAAAYYSAQEEYYRSAAEDARGRNPHPRLLWRSVLDRDALEVLDAHHERIRGGPLPRLSLPETDSGDSIEVGQFGPETTKPICLGASGLDREREHAGVGDVEMKDRVRRARRRDPNRRTWSQAGRQWSRQMEQCGL